MPREGRFLLVSNHLFAFDPIVFYYAMPWAELAFVSKTENFSLPIVAQVMRKILCLPLDRNNDREALKAILKAIQFLKEDKASIAVFPEGGTSKSGLLQPFRNGAFKIAQKAGVLIVVCALTNTKAILKNMFRRKTDVYLDVLDVVPASEVTAHKTTAEIGDRVHKKFSEGLAKRGACHGAAILKSKSASETGCGFFHVRICYRPYQKAFQRALGRYNCPKHRRKLDCTDDASQRTDRVRILPESRQHRRHAQDEQQKPHFIPEPSEEMVRKLPGVLIFGRARRTVAEKHIDFLRRTFGKILP